MDLEMDPETKAALDELLAGGEPTTELVAPEEQEVLPSRVMRAAVEKHEAEVRGLREELAQAKRKMNTLLGKQACDLKRLRELEEAWKADAEHDLCNKNSTGNGGVACTSPRSEEAGLGGELGSAPSIQPVAESQSAASARVGYGYYEYDTISSDENDDEHQENNDVRGSRSSSSNSITEDTDKNGDSDTYDAYGCDDIPSNIVGRRAEGIDEAVASDGDGWDEMSDDSANGLTAGEEHKGVDCTDGGNEEGNEHTHSSHTQHSLTTTERVASLHKEMNLCKQKHDVEMDRLYAEFKKTFRPALNLTQYDLSEYLQTQKQTTERIASLHKGLAEEMNQCKRKHDVEMDRLRAEFKKIHHHRGGCEVDVARQSLGRIRTTRHDRASNFTEGTRLARIKNDPVAQKRGYTITAHTSAEFLNRIRSIGEIIIRDHYKPQIDRVFHPKDVGGVAGGVKYIVDGLFFKFADPSDGPYGGSFENANKAVGHELKGAIAIFHAAQAVIGDGNELHSSLLAVVHHLGFCVLVMPELELGKDTLKVGSDDQTRTLPHGTEGAVEQSLNEQMNQVARQLGLAVHEIRRAGRVVRLGFGADVEGHVDRRGVARVVDTARVFPPEAIEVTTLGCPPRYHKSNCRQLLPPTVGNMSIFWRLLRPELVAIVTEKCSGNDYLAEPGLSADGFSSFSNHANDAYVHMRRLVTATQILMDEQVPRVASALGVRAPESWRDGATLTAIFHQFGVNMRHAGAVWKVLNEKCEALCKDDKETSASREGEKEEIRSKLHDCKYARRGVVQEMFVRSAKNILRRDLRNAMKVGASVLVVHRIVCEMFTGIASPHSSPSSSSSSVLFASSSDVETSSSSSSPSPYSSSSTRASTSEPSPRPSIASGSVGAPSKHLERIWLGVKERFGVSDQIQRGGIDVVAAVLRISKAVGVRLTPTCVAELQVYAKQCRGALVRETSTPGAVSAPPEAVDRTPDSETKVDDAGASTFRLDREGSDAHELASQFDDDDETKTTESVASETVAIPVAANGDSGTAMGCQQCGANLKGVARGVGRKLGAVPKGVCNAKCFEGKTRLDNETKSIESVASEGAAKQAVVSMPQKGFAFSEADVKRLEPRVKFMDVDDYAQGQVLLLELQERSQIETIKDEEKLRVLGLCDIKFVSALATYGGDHFGITETLPITIASTRLAQVWLMCKSAKIVPVHVREKTWKSRIEGIDAFATIALLPNENVGARADTGLCGGESKQRSEMTEDLDEAARSRVDAWIQFPNLSTVKVQRTVELYKMLYDARLADMAWEGTKMHVLRSMESDTIEGVLEQIMELLEELLKIDFYNDNLRRKVVSVFTKYHDWSQNPPSRILYSFPTVMRLLAEAKWLELKKDDLIFVGGLRATIEKDEGGGVYKVRRIGIRTLFQALFRTRYFALRKYQMIGMFAFTVGTCACFGYSGQFMYRSTDWWQGETAGGFWVGTIWGSFLIGSLMFTAFDVAEYFRSVIYKEIDITDLKEQTTDFRGRGKGSKTDALKSVTSDRIENVKEVSEWMRQDKPTEWAARIVRLVTTNASGASDDVRDAFGRASKLRLIIDDGDGDEIREAFNHASRTRSIVDDLFIALQHAFRNMGKGSDIDTHFLQVR
jgi:hypothetical protein